jgi:hypothetical protein
MTFSVRLAVRRACGCISNDEEDNASAQPAATSLRPAVDIRVSVANEMAGPSLS